ncbi:MAG: hypothetical protein J5586_03465 [Clostridia bacterium]|jgi:hypothetical protein|nr:hypothetical protein [Clostridia bacterium]
MKYKLREGIVQTKICGVFLLVPTRAASESCPHIQKVGLLLYSAIELLERGEPIEKIYQMYQILTKKSDEEVRELVDGQLETLREKGFLVAAEDDHEQG